MRIYNNAGQIFRCRNIEKFVDILCIKHRCACKQLLGLPTMETGITGIVHVIIMIHNNVNISIQIMVPKFQKWIELTFEVRQEYKWLLDLNSRGHYEVEWGHFLLNTQKHNLIMRISMELKIEILEYSSNKRDIRGQPIRIAKIFFLKMFKNEF